LIAGWTADSFAPSMPGDVASERIWLDAPNETGLITLAETEWDPEDPPKDARLRQMEARGNPFRRRRWLG
jgi:hypothetical protein